jgi:quercetin dioxygenase-like cupin family protein
MTLQPKASVNLPHSNQAKHVPAGTGTAYWGPGELMRFLITSEESGGAIFISEISVAPGGGTSLHIHHHEDEAFRLLEGTLTIQVGGGDTITASAGDFAFLPRGIAHSFKNAGDCDAKALVLITPAGLEGFFLKYSSLRRIVPRCRRLPLKRGWTGRARRPPVTDWSFFHLYDGESFPNVSHHS